MEFRNQGSSLLPSDSVFRIVIFCGPPAMLEGPLSFHLSHCLYGWMYWCMQLFTDVRSRQHQKVNLRSLIRTKCSIFVELGMWVVGGTSTTHVVCHHLMRLFNTSLAYLFWLANNKKVKYHEFCMGYIDETWYVGSDGHKHYPCGLLSLNAHI